MLLCIISLGGVTVAFKGRKLKHREVRFCAQKDTGLLVAMLRKHLRAPQASWPLSMRSYCLCYAHHS